MARARHAAQVTGRVIEHQTPPPWSSHSAPTPANSTLALVVHVLFPQMRNELLGSLVEDNLQKKGDETSWTPSSPGIAQIGMFLMVCNTMACFDGVQHCGMILMVCNTVILVQLYDTPTSRSIETKVQVDRHRCWQKNWKFATNMRLLQKSGDDPRLPKGEAPCRKQAYKTGIPSSRTDIG